MAGAIKPVENKSIFYKNKHKFKKKLIMIINLQNRLIIMIMKILIKISNKRTI